jgi:hypothetical protein
MPTVSRRLRRTSRGTRAIVVALTLALLFV